MTDIYVFVLYVKGSFPLIAKNSRCEYVHPITMLDSFIQSQCSTVYFNYIQTLEKRLKIYKPSMHLGPPWRNRQNNGLSPLSSWVRFSLRTHVKRVSQRSAESRGFSPGAPVSFHMES